MSIYDYALDDGMAAIARTEQQLEDRHYIDALEAADLADRWEREHSHDLDDLTGNIAAGLEQAVQAVDYADLTRLARETGVLR